MLCLTPVLKFLSRKDKTSLQRIVLNEPRGKRSGKVDLLLGTPVLWRVVRKIHKHLNSSLVLLDTIFGAVLCGASNDFVENSSFHTITS